MKYNHKKIESKWQRYWEKHPGLTAADDKSDKEKQYILDMFPYPSGDGLHIGHIENYTASDIMSRYFRMRGKNVLHPQGWDAFGLPAENYAIKTKIHPAGTTKKAIINFKKQMNIMGFSYDWSREVNSSDPEYYKWTQWFFLLLYKNSLAYKKKGKVNWCDSCQTVLANEQAEGGVCERCGQEVVQKDLEQWYFKITNFIENLPSEAFLPAEALAKAGAKDGRITSGLLGGLEKIDWPESTKAAQRNWIGKSEGTEIIFPIKDSDKKVNIITTRADTIFGATFMVLAPEHFLISELAGEIKNIDEVNQYLKATAHKTDFERGMLSRKKTGVKLDGIMAINPVTNKEIPIYISDFVLATYGTGAIMSVPAHDQRDFDFAKKFKLPIIPVIEKPKSLKTLALVQLYDEDKSEIADKIREIAKAKEYATPSVRVYEVGINYAPQLAQIIKDRKVGKSTDYKKIESGNDFTLEVLPPAINFLQVYEGDGSHINSDFLNGLNNEDAINKMAAWLSESKIGWAVIHYRLRDWLVSRQRYWGAPIPIIYCDKCGEVPVPEKDLPVQLPTDVDFMPTGESPLVKSKKFQNVKCPKCGDTARREADTMDTFVCSSWYYFRYTDPKNDKEFASKKMIEKWLAPAHRNSKSEGGVDLYIGGAEHVVLHLLYARFFTKVLHKLGYIDFDEPFLKLRHQGIILAPDGRKMSKSLGNVVNPEDVVKEYGADALRLFEMFMGPLEEMKPWNTKGIIGISRFLKRIWKLKSQFPISNFQTNPNSQNSKLKNKKDVILSGLSLEALAKREAKNLNHLVHKTIKKVGEDIENLKFNTAISALMILVNESNGGVVMSRDQYETFLILLAPFAPHIAEELWFSFPKASEDKSHSKYKESIFKQPWPEYDKNLIKEDTIQMPVQINGKVRTVLTVPADISEEEAIKLLTSDVNIIKWLGGKEPRKVIFVEGRLVNIVV